MKKLLLLAACILSVSFLNATHNRAGEISYLRIAPFTQPGGTTPVYTYSITVIKYMDDGPGVADRCQDTVDFGDGSKGVAPRVNGGTTPCLCGSLNGTAIGCGSLIVNSPSYKVKYCVYSIVHTYNNAGNYTVRSSDPNRNAGIANIPNSANQAFTIEARIMLNASTGNNSSPVLMSAPVDQATVGACFTHNLGAIDADGDSISYSPMVCLGTNGAITGYTYPGFSSSQIYSVDGMGILTWCVPQTIGEYNLAIGVKEWRKNTSGVYQVNGYTMRDMQILVKAGIVGINKNGADESLAVFPNPFSEMLEINSGSKKYSLLEAFVYANDGSLVYKSSYENVNGKLALSLNSLKPGIYQLLLKTEQGTEFKRIIKE